MMHIEENIQGVSENQKLLLHKRSSSMIIGGQNLKNKFYHKRQNSIESGLNISFVSSKSVITEHQKNIRKEMGQ